MSTDIVGTPASCTFDAALTMSKRSTRRRRSSRRSAGTTTSGGTRTGSWTSSASSAALTRRPLRRGLPLLEDLGDLAGSASSSGWTSTSPWTSACAAGPSRTTSGSARRSRRSTRSSRAARPCVLLAPRAAQRAGGPPFDMAPVRATAEGLCPGVGLWRTSRFDPGEKANDPGFVDRLVPGFDSYVNDAFGASHRAHASVVGPPHACRARRGSGSPARSRCSAGCSSTRAAVRGGRRRGEGRRQARGRCSPPRWTASSSAAPWRSRSSRPGSAASARRCSTRRGSRTAARCSRRAAIVLPTDVVALSPGARSARARGTPGEVRKVFEGDLPEGWTGLDVGPTRRPPSPRVATAGRSCGTARWARSRTTGSPRARATGRGRGPRPRASPSWAAATARGPWPSGPRRTRIAFVSTGGGASLSFSSWTATSRARRPARRTQRTGGA